jgi:hypothetical protein
MGVMISNWILGAYLFPGDVTPDTMNLPLFLQADAVNPFRVILIVGVAILWFLCFSALFYKDKRKAKLRYLQKRRRTGGFEEKRAHTRISYPMTVLYRVLGRKETSDMMLVSNARNISLTGILLEVKEDLAPGSRLELTLRSSTRESLVIHGTVNRREYLSSLKIYAVGVSLDIGNTEIRNTLADFIEHESKKEVL